jgi:methionine synthase II (cobalamin-independent)
MFSDPLFATYLVGGLPRPRWVRDVFEDRRSGRLSFDNADRLLDAAVPATVTMQGRAGLTSRTAISSAGPLPWVPGLHRPAL